MYANRNVSLAIALVASVFVLIGSSGARGAEADVPRKEGESVVIVAGLPASSDNPVNVPSGSQSESLSADSFFRQGLFGIVGGRTAWWGWVLGLMLYIPGFSNSAVQVGQMARAHCYRLHGDVSAAGGVACLSGAIGAAISYVIFWWLPGTAIGWGLFALVGFLSGTIAAGSAAQQAY